MATTNSKKKKGRGVVAAIGKVVGTLLLVGILTCAFLACFAAVYIKTVILPDAHVEAQSYSTALSSTIYYTDKTTGQAVELQSLYGTQNRVWVSFDEIPQYLRDAAVAIEDQRFYTHSGVDWIRTAKGVLSLFTGAKIEGGSTITQQLLKNMTTYDDVTVKRKILEIFRALDFDANHEKDEILEMYLNYIYFGKKCYGVATASQYYFGKDVGELSLAECASLISITNNPSAYNPYVYPENNAYRANLVLYAMLEQGKISQAEYDQAKAQVDAGLNFTQGESESEAATNILSWYEEQVVSDVIDDLVEELGYSNELASNMVYSGGLKIYAYVDPEIQAKAEEVYENRENLPLVSESGQQIQSAIAIIDTEGNVVALVGSMGEKEGNALYNMASMAHRQPGSSIKPLAVYAPAIDTGLITPATTFDDTPVMRLGGSNWPSNSYGKYYGLMDVADAVKQSSNPVAVRALQLLGLSKSAEYLEENFHITTLEEDDYNQLGNLALGGLSDGVSVLEMAAAYSVFPRNGVYVEPRTYSRVENADGEVILDNTASEPQTVLKETTAWYINDMLTDVVTKSGGTGTAANWSGMTIAGKTGSTNSNNDRWFVGYTPYYTAAVWTGYETPERIYYSGSNPAITLWKLVMEPIHEGLENKEFDQPSGLQSVQVCADSGKRATSACANDPRGSRVTTVYLFADDIPSESCDLHQEVEVCTACPVEGVEGLYHLAGEYCPRGTEEGLESTVKTIAVLNYSRDGGYGADSAYFLGYLQAQGSCTVHTGEAVTQPEEYDPATFDPGDEATWPTQEQWPGFSIEDESTWPVVTGPETSEEPNGETPDDGGEGGGVIILPPEAEGGDHPHGEEPSILPQ